MNVDKPLPEFKQVISSQIKEIAYDELSEMLYIRFKANSVIYKYHPVSKQEYQGLISADSVGKYFNSNIKNKHFNN